MSNTGDDPFKEVVQPEEWRIITARRQRVVEHRLRDPQAIDRFRSSDISQVARDRLDPLIDAAHEAVVAIAADDGCKPAENKEAAGKEAKESPAEDALTIVSKFQADLSALRSELSDDECGVLVDLFVYPFAEAVDDSTALVGVALSGGGVRSAAFNLGVLQALHAGKEFERVDFLSTVSGGGYAGSSVSYFMHKPGETFGRFPFTSRPAEESRMARIDADEKRLAQIHADKSRLEWIRRRASYLTPGEGLNRWSLAAAMLRGIFLNLVVLVPVLLGIFWLIARPPVAPGDRLLSEHLDTWLMQPWGVLTSMFVVMLAMFVHRMARLPVDSWGRYTSQYRIGIRLLVWVIFMAALWLAELPQYAEWKNMLGGRLDQAWPLIAGAFVVAWVLGIVKTRGATQQRVVGEFIELLSWAVVFLVTFASSDLLKSFAQNVDAILYPPFFFYLLALMLIVTLKWLVSTLFFAMLSATRVRLNFMRHRLFSIEYGDMLLFATFALLFGALPIVHHFVFEDSQWLEWGREILSGFTVGGVLTTAAGWLLRDRGLEDEGLSGNLLRVGLGLLIVAVMLGSYHWVNTYSARIELPAFVVGALLIAYVAVQLTTDPNYVSMHRYYRNRLLEAFMRGRSVGSPVADPAESVCANDDPGAPVSDNLLLSDLDVTRSGGPYHLINTNLVTSGSRNSHRRLRGGDNFIFSQSFIGSEATKWTASSTKGFGGMNIATAMSISGAAIDPNAGESRSWPLRIVMTWLNVRLGYWMPNPNPDHYRSNFFNDLLLGSYLWLVIKEMLNVAREDWCFVRLTDGGHFENLGLYELLRRSCQFIVVSDASADPEYTFSDLARALERARVDMGVRVSDLRTDALRPGFLKATEKESKKPTFVSRLAEKPCAFANIDYDDGKTGRLVYLTTTLYPELTEEVLGYARQNEAFPDEPTSDQFFSEEQFEAYRELGSQAMSRAMDDDAFDFARHSDGPEADAFRALNMRRLCFLRRSRLV